MAKKKGKTPDAVVDGMNAQTYGVAPKGGSKTNMPKWFGDYVDAHTPTQRKSPNPGAIPSQLKGPNPAPKPRRGRTK